jgi:hypothetical protein
VGSQLVSYFSDSSVPSLTYCLSGPGVGESLLRGLLRECIRLLTISSSLLSQGPCDVKPIGHQGFVTWNIKETGLTLPDRLTRAKALGILSAVHIVRLKSIPHPLSVFMILFAILESEDDIFDIDLLYKLEPEMASTLDALPSFKSGDHLDLTDEKIQRLFAIYLPSVVSLLY